MTAIWWVRRDLRLRDNTALDAALERSAGKVIPVYVLDHEIENSPAHRAATRRRAFLLDGLAALDGELQLRGSRLVVRAGRVPEVLAGLLRETGATVIVAERDHSLAARTRDASAGARVPLALTGTPGARAPEEVLKQDGTAYRRFSAFRRAWLALPPIVERDLLPAPAHLPPPPVSIGSESIPLRDATLITPRASEAERWLDHFTLSPDAPIDRYAAERDRLDIAATSLLSPYLHLGMLSARAVAARAADTASARGSAQSQTGARRWLDELIWRDFYLHTAESSLATIRGGAPAVQVEVEWRNEPAEIDAWRTGRTGIPIVDAAMRQLAATGWMHNRARMLVASFLVKHLLVDWRIGAAWFMSQLIDGDVSSNSGNWRWVAGTGVDAAPFFRVFNPVIQARKFDPNGDFTRRWVHELRNVHGPLLQEPWRMSTAAQQATGVRIGSDYPAPVVDLGVGRIRALKALAQARARSR